MKNYHFCISGGDEVLFRTEKDYTRAFNTLAISAAEMDVALSADAIMSTHMHVSARTNNLKPFLGRFWKSYTRYFNAQYGRNGHLGIEPFVVEIHGFYHWLTAICYVLRNPVHHGVAPTPFAYRHCSAKAFFRKELGFTMPFDYLPDKSYYRYLPKGVVPPDEYKMDSSGLFMRETVMDISDVEHRFGTARSYLFYMNRLSGEEWKREQDKDLSGEQSITLELLEQNAYGQSLSEMLRHEHGKSNYLAMTDLAVCDMIDMQILPSMGRDSVYELSRREKIEIGRFLQNDHLLPDAQLRRCLVL